jgi:hypothetical protein
VTVAPVSSKSPTSGVLRGAMAPLVQERLAKALGAKRATEVSAPVLEQLGGRALETPQDLLEFAEIMIKHGGLVQAVARSLKVQALLRGAVER